MYPRLHPFSSGAPGATHLAAQGSSSSREWMARGTHGCRQSLMLVLHPGDQCLPPVLPPSETRARRPFPKPTRPSVPRPSGGWARLALLPHVRVCGGAPCIGLH